VHKADHYIAANVSNRLISKHGDSERLHFQTRRESQSGLIHNVAVNSLGKSAVIFKRLLCLYYEMHLVIQMCRAKVKVTDDGLFGNLLGLELNKPNWQLFVYKACNIYSNSCIFIFQCKKETNQIQFGNYVVKDDSTLILTALQLMVTYIL